MSKTTPSAIRRAGTAFAIVAAAVLILAAKPRHDPSQDYPGFWKVGNLVYAQCAYWPYDSYIDPSTGYERYMRYDFSTMRPNPGKAGTFAGYGGANHTEQWYGNDGKIYPIFPGGVEYPIGFYPGPPPEAGLCTRYIAKNPGQACPRDPYTYKNLINDNVVWHAGYLAFAERIAEECGSALPPTPTPPVPPTPTPTPCWGRRGGCLTFPP
jgi:hypothetical protein